MREFYIQGRVKRGGSQVERRVTAPCPEHSCSISPDSSEPTLHSSGRQTIIGSFSRIYRMVIKGLSRLSRSCAGSAGVTATPLLPLQLPRDFLSLGRNLRRWSRLFFCLPGTASRFAKIPARTEKMTLRELPTSREPLDSVMAIAMTRSSGSEPDFSIGAYLAGSEFSLTGKPGITCTWSFGAGRCGDGCRLIPQQTAMGIVQ